MSYARHLHRHADFDLAERIIASGRIKRKEPVKTKNKARVSATYRGARRNMIRQRRAEELAVKRRSA